MTAEPTGFTDAIPQPEPARLSPARTDAATDDAKAHPLPPRAGTDDARNEERKTSPSRNRGVTDI